jgi:hypothetical protein
MVFMDPTCLPWARALLKLLDGDLPPGWGCRASPPPIWLKGLSYPLSPSCFGSDTYPGYVVRSRT